MHRWNSKMDCTPDQIAELNSGADVTNINLTFEKFFEEALEKERQFSEFFKNVKSSMRNSLISKVYQKYNEQDRKLQNIYVEKELLIHNALMDNFDTPLALAELSNLVKAANTYLMQPSDQIKVPLLRKVQRYVHRILQIFGLFEEDFGGSLDAEKGGAVSKEDVLQPVMEALINFRIDVRN